ncbi:MAG: hypothetical protein U0802_26760 [Candidatus Binatia bacterium]
MPPADLQRRVFIAAREARHAGQRVPEVDDDDAQLALAGRDRGLGGGQRAHHEAVAVDLGQLEAAADRAERAKAAGDDMDLGLEPEALHPDGRVDGLLPSRR